MIALLFTALLAQAVPDAWGDEAAYYKVDYLVQPEGARIEVGGMDFLPDGRLVLSTRRGQVWIVDDPLAADPAQAKFHLFAEGLQEGLGLTVVDGEIYVLQRSELSILRDKDGDGRCDEIETVSNQWGLSGNYHEFAYGLPRDPQGNFYVAFNVSFGDPWWHGRAPVFGRGWILQIAPDGTTLPFAMGFRSPAGLGTNAAGELFMTDNQGDWEPACPIHHVQEGRFYGHPASLQWTSDYDNGRVMPSDTVPPKRERENAAAWIPYDWSRSAGQILCDRTGGKFGPFGDQLFVAELTNGLVVRADLEKVRGEYQGAVWLFRQHIGSAVRLCFAKDGTLFCGMTDRGWGGQPPGDGVARVRWTGVVPMEMQHVRLRQDGFEIEFTEPVKAGAAIDPSKMLVQQYDYNWWWEYGSPVQREKKLPVGKATLSPDRRKLVLSDVALEPARMARFRLDGVVSESGKPLLHDEVAYTINQLPGGPATKEKIARVVEPPPEREGSGAGILFLCEGDALDAWKQEGWQQSEVQLDPADPTKLVLVAPKPPEPPEPPKSGDEPKPGDPPPKPPDPPDVLTNIGAEHPSELVSRFEFGDCDVHVDFMLPKGGNSGVYLMGRYEIQLRDSAGVKDLGFGDCGGIYEGRGETNTWRGKAPMFNAFRGPGQWHGMDIRFRAPRFDASGKKVQNAIVERVMIDDTLMQENVEVTDVTGGALEGEVPLGPLRLQGDHGNVAFKGIRVRAKNLPADADGWTRIFDGKTLDGWQISDNGQWKVENGEIVGTGPASHLFSPRGDYKNLEFRAKAKISDEGNSGMYFRVTYGPGWPAGYEAQINSTGPDPVRTGSLYNLDKIRARLIPADTWFTQHVICRDEPGGVHVVIELNGVKVVDYIDKDRKHALGHVALQQHNDGSVVHFKDLEVRELK